MAILTIEQITNVDDLPRKTINVPAWGGEIIVRMMTKAQQHGVRMSAIHDGALNEEELEIGILVEAIVDPPMTREHIEVLRNKNAEVIDEILAEVFQMSAMDKEAVARARDDFQEGSAPVDGVPHSEESEEISSGDAPGDEH